MRQRKRALWILVGILFFLSACGSSEETFLDAPLPDFSGILNAQGEPAFEVNEPAAPALPVNVYFDNTGSMEGFTIDERGKRNPDPSYVKLINSLRIMGRMRATNYYVLDAEKQDWALYEEELYANFSGEGFHIDWNSGQSGPLSKLCSGERLDQDSINIVLTDLAEQQQNNTKLAEQIQKMCADGRCEADLYAFMFEFHGKTQVPDPNTVSKMLNEAVDGARPYYMILVGPAVHMEQYCEELGSLLGGAGLQDGKDYYTATSRMDIHDGTASLEDVVFEPFAGYDEILHETEEKEADEKPEEDGEKEDGETEGEEWERYSKNLLPYEDTGIICPGMDVAAFYYQKVEGISKKQGGWRLNFYVPLQDFGDPGLEYSYNFFVYRLDYPDAEEEGLEAAWTEDGTPRIQITSEIREDFEQGKVQSPAVLYVTCQDKEAEKGHEPREQELLLILKITAEQVYSFERPQWIEEFDTGDTGDYFTRTFNLVGFYDVLFGNKNTAADGIVHIQSNYAQIPIILTGLEE